LYGKTQSFTERQQSATVDEAGIIIKVTWTSQTLNEPTRGGCKVDWRGDSIVHHYEMRCQPLHLLQYWKTLANIHLVKHHAGKGIIKETSRKTLQLSAVAQENLDVIEAAPQSLSVCKRPHPLRGLNPHQLRAHVSKGKKELACAAANIDESTARLHLGAHQSANSFQQWIHQEMVEPTLVKVIFSFLDHADFYHIILPMVSNNQTLLYQKGSAPLQISPPPERKAEEWQLQLADD
jgi:hypothetical protein